MRASLIVASALFAVAVVPVLPASAPSSSVDNNLGLHLITTVSVLGDVNGTMPTPDGKHLLSFRGMGDVVGAVVIDGKLTEVLPGFIRDSLVVSSDGQRFAYKVMTDAHLFSIVLDGVVGKAYEAIAPAQPVFSPDGKQLSYIADVKPSPDKSEQCIVTNGVEGKSYASIWPWLKYSPDGKHLFYAASKTGKIFSPGISGISLGVVLDGVEGKEYPFNGGSMPQQQVTFSPDGKRLAFVVWKGKESRAVVDGVEGPSYDDIRSLVFSSDSKKVAFFATRGHQRMVVVNGMEGPSFDLPSPGVAEEPIIFSPDSNHFAYRALVGKKYRAVLDGTQGKEYTSIDLGTGFSPDGGHFAYSAQVGDAPPSFCVVVDKVEGKSYVSVSPPVFSPDGHRIAYWAQAERKTMVVVDGVEGEAFGRPAVGPVFSPDGRHVAYAAQRSQADPYQVIVVDGVESTPDSIVFDPRLALSFRDIFQFVDFNTLRFMAVRMPDREYVRVTVAIQSGDH